MIAIVTGDRHWKDGKAVRRELFKRRKKLRLVIEGGASGADDHAHIAASLLGIQTCRMDANWKSKLHRAAGPVRNGMMLKVALAVSQAWKEQLIVLAFHPDLRKSKGTKNMVTQARKAKVLVKIFRK